MVASATFAACNASSARLVPGPTGRLRRRGIRPRIDGRMVSPRNGLVATVDDRAHPAWRSGWRRLRIRYERSSERFDALVLLTCLVICLNALQQPPW